MGITFRGSTCMALYDGGSKDHDGHHELLFLLNCTPAKQFEKLSTATMKIQMSNSLKEKAYFRVPTTIPK